MQRQWIMGGLAVALLAAAGLLLARGLRSGPRGLPAQFELLGACLACGEEVTATLPRRAPAPAACPLCGRRAVYPWFFCNACRRRFVPALLAVPDGPPRLPTAPVCPRCGTNDCVAFDLNDPSQQVEGPDLPLPDWPVGDADQGGPPGP